MKRIICILALLFAQGGAAFSLDLTHPPLASKVRTARPVRPLASLAVRADLHDLAFAQADAAAHGAKDREACWAAWGSAVGTTQSARMAARGLALTGSGGASLIESRAQHRDAFGPASPFVVACTPIAKSLGLTLRDFVQSVVK